MRFKPGAFQASMVLFALGLATATPAAGADHEWKFFTYFGANDLPTNMHRAFAEDLTKATNGRLKVTVYSGGELPYKFSDVLRLVATNQVQMGDVAVGLNAGELPGLNVFDLPFLCTSFDSFYKASAAVAPSVDSVLQSKFGIGSLIHWTMPAAADLAERPHPEDRRPQGPQDPQLVADARRHAAGIWRLGRNSERR